MDQVFISEKDHGITVIPERLALFDTPRYKAQPQHAGSVEVGHGRVEERTIACIVDPMRFAEAECYGSLNRCQGLPSVLKGTRGREEKKHGQRAQEVNYYICSRTDCEGISQTIRAHWSIENGLH